MNPPHFSRRLAKGAYRATQIFVFILSGFAVLAVVAFVFLRTCGVPGPLLREVVRRVNAVGIPVEVDGITLTLHGWRAEQVRYYSANPDDLEPLFLARQVFFSVRNSKLKGGEGSHTWGLDVKAIGVGINPSVEWGVAIPASSPVRQVERIEASLGFSSDRILISHGEMDWLGSHFKVDGTILKGERKTGPAPTRKQKTLFPVFITESQFQSFENHLKTLSLPNGARVEIDFSIDTADYSASRVDLAVEAEEMGFRGVGFSGAEIAASYAYPTLQIERVGLFQGNQSLQLNGEYNLDSKTAEGALRNSITSNRLLLLLPDWIHDGFAKAELRIDHLPRLEIGVGPAPVGELLNHLSGAFSICGLGYQGVEVDTLRGRVKRENNRLEFTELQGSVLGQEARAEEMGSAMHGGSAEGTVFWDGNTREFGVDVDACLDPNILVQALSPIKIATNIIRRFRFEDRPPRGHVSVGASLNDLDTFYIDIQAQANDASIQGVEFTSVNITQTYRHGKLTLDPVVAMQGVDFIEGSALLDFHASTVVFNGLSSMDPADLEDLIYPGIDLFGNHIKAGGDVRIAAHGVFDWGSMRQTDFSVTVEAERLGIPIAVLDRFTAEVVGDGPVIAVKNASFGLYGGEGSGEFSLAWNPSQENLPYETDLSFSGVDFNECLLFLRGDRPVDVSGTMAGNAHIEADFSTNFFSSANGGGGVRVEEGQLADLPLFNGFSRLMRKVFPSFTLFSITSFRGNFRIVDGVILSEDAYFEGDVLSAKGRGSYSQASGFDALVQVQMFSEGRISKVVRAITDPLMKLLEMKLEGTLSDPSWKLDKF